MLEIIGATIISVLVISVGGFVTYVTCRKIKKSNNYPRQEFNIKEAHKSRLEDCIVSGDLVKIRSHRYKRYLKVCVSTRVVLLSETGTTFEVRATGGKITSSDPVLLKKHKTPLCIAFTRNSFSSTTRVEELTASNLPLCSVNLISNSGLEYGNKIRISNSGGFLNNTGKEKMTPVIEGFTVEMLESPCILSGDQWIFEKV